MWMLLGLAWSSPTRILVEELVSAGTVLANWWVKSQGLEASEAVSHSLTDKQFECSRVSTQAEEMVP